MRNVLFVCAQNRLRSPTAEQIFSKHPGWNVSSAGTNADAENPLSAELVLWADTIFVMERRHRSKIQGKYQRELKNTRLICLHIDDEYEYMAPELVRLLQVKVSRYFDR